MLRLVSISLFELGSKFVLLLYNNLNSPVRRTHQPDGLSLKMRL